MMLMTIMMVQKMMAYIYMIFDDNNIYDADCDACDHLWHPVVPNEGVGQHQKLPSDFSNDMMIC